MQPISKISRASLLFTALTVLYIVLTFALPASTITKANLHISDGQYYALLLALRLPIIIVWCMAFFAYQRLHSYTNRIQGTPEGLHFRKITRGVFFIVWGLPIPSIIAALLNAIANNNPGFLMYALIITNYLNLLVSLSAFIFISSGAHSIAQQSRAHPTIGHIRWAVLFTVAIGVLFCYLISVKLQGSNLKNSYNAYYLPNILVWTTIVIPYLYAWFLGIFAAMEIMLVARTTPGIIYRRALLYLAFGLVMIIISLCMVQYYRSVVPRVGHLTLSYTLILNYLIYILLGIGSLVMATGARRLKRIEEI